jgi:sugar phosphate isomerase/epimerase
MNRRHLIALLPGAAALGAAGRAAAKPIPAAALTKAGFAISVQCWSFRQFTLSQAIEMAAAAGASGVEIFPGQALGGEFGEAKAGPGLPADVIAGLLELCAKHGITPVNFGVTGIPNDEAAARPFFEFAKQLGLYGITTESIEAIDLIEKLAREYDLTVSFHNHPRQPENPGYKMWDPEFVFNSVKDRDPRIGICADTGHWATSGLDPLAVVEKTAPRVRAFHMKDRGSIEGHSHDRPFGTGVINIPGMLDAVRAAGFAGNVSIEYEHNWDKSLPEVAQCAGYLRACAQIAG